MTCDSPTSTLTNMAGSIDICLCSSVVAKRTYRSRGQGDPGRMAAAVAKPKAKARVRAKAKPKARAKTVAKSRAKTKARAARKKPAAADMAAAPERNPFDQPPLPGQLTLFPEPEREAKAADEETDAASNMKKRRRLALGPPVKLQAVKTEPKEEAESESDCDGDQEEIPNGTGADGQPRMEASAFLQFVEGENELMPSQEDPVEVIAEGTRSREDMFQFGVRNIQRIHKYFGVKPLQTLSGNLSSLSILSLYSGLGGAEIAAAITATSLRSYIETNGGLQGSVDFPMKPHNLLACDINSDCQKILKSHPEA